MKASLLTAYTGSRTGLVMWIAHERRPLALASSSYFFVTKPVGEPTILICVKSRAIPHSEVALNWLIKPAVGRDMRQEKGQTDCQITATMKHTGPEDGSAHLSTRTQQPTLRSVFRAQGELPLERPNARLAEHPTRHASSHNKGQRCIAWCFDFQGKIFNDGCFLRCFSLQ